MKILVIGGGGREHALVWKLSQSASLDKIWCAPGNAGIAQQAECVALDAADVKATVALAERLKPDLTVVGPEAPLVAGLADEFAKRGWAIAGPEKQGAQLEGSKVFAKQFLARHSVPTARLYCTCDSAEKAYRALRGVKWPAVIKADGLCAGKGVLVAASADEAANFVERLMEKRELGEGGERVLIEEALEGEELSYIVLTDGARVAPLLPARDHKSVFDGNKGSNTGGMGAYTTETLLSAEVEETILEAIVRPTIRGLQTDGIPYRGFLYFGLMLTPKGPKVLEFNCRLGDPETQAILARVDFNLAETLAGVARGTLVAEKLKWKGGASVCVVMASGGYPGKFVSGKRIEGIRDAEKIPGVKVLHAGTKQEAEEFITSGGRVLGVTATGATVEAAVAAAYEAAGKIRFEGAHYRRDIGTAASKRRVAS